MTEAELQFPACIPKRALFNVPARNRHEIMQGLPCCHDIIILCQGAEHGTVALFCCDKAQGKEPDNFISILMELSTSEQT